MPLGPPPPTTTVTSATFSADTGSSASDFITKTAAQTISGALSAGTVAGETVQVSLNNGSTWITASNTLGASTWELAEQTLESSDTLQVRVVYGGSAGVSTAWSHAYELDTTAPTASVTTASVAAGTSITTAQSTEPGVVYLVNSTFTGNGSAQVVDWDSLEAAVLEGTVTKATVSAANTDTSIATTDLPAGTYYTYTVDVAGNLSAKSTAAVTLTAALPGVPTTTVTSATFSADTGSSASDFITKTAAQTISGALSAGTVAGETVQVSLNNGSTWVLASNTLGQSTWELAGQTLTASNTLQVRVTNTGGSSTALSQAYVLDTTAPTATVSTLELTADTGISLTDFITNSAAQKIFGTLSVDSLAIDERVEVSVDNGAHWSDATVTAAGSGNVWAAWEITTSLNAAVAPASTLQVRVVDAAGNTGTVKSQAYVLDTTAPTLTSANPADDAGSVGVSSNLTLTFSEDLATNSGTIELHKSSDASLIETFTLSSANVSGSVVTLNPTADLAYSSGYYITTGVFSLGLPGLMLGLPQNSPVIKDVAGNQFTGIVDSTTLNFTTQSAPSVGVPTTTVTSATFSADTGSSSSDFITKTAAQTISGALSAGTVAGETVEVSLDNGSTWVLASNTLGQSTWELAEQTLASSNTLQVRVTNSAGVSTAWSHAYVLDTTAPTLTSANPADNAGGVGVSSNLTLTFSEDLATDSGTIELHKSSDASLVETFTLSSTNVSGSVVTLNPTADLAYSTDYYITAGGSVPSLPKLMFGQPQNSPVIKDVAGNRFAGIVDSTTLNFTTQSAPLPPDNPVDDDQDGVSATVEDSVPGLAPQNGGPAVAGDGNGDGIKDSEQAAVTSLSFLKTDTSVSNPSNAPKVFVTLVADAKDGQVNAGSKAVITSIAQKDAPANLPAGSSLPLGLFDFSAKAAAPGSTENFSIFIDGDININGYWKEVQSGPSKGTWVNLASSTYGGKVVTEQGKTRLDFSIQDGGIFDDDGKADGTISDPGGPGLMVLTNTAPTINGVTGVLQNVVVDVSAALDDFTVADADNNLLTVTLTANNGTLGGLMDSDLLKPGIQLTGLASVINAAIKDATFTASAVGAANIDISVSDGTDPALGATYHLMASASPGATCAFDPFRIDADKDGMTDAVELMRGSNSAVKNNDVFSQNELFVDQLYRDFFGREGYNDAGSAHWLNALSTGVMNRVDVLATTLNSAEFDSHAGAVIRLYHAALGRSPEFCGYNYWLGQANEGMSASDMGRAFLESAEFATKQDGLDNAGFVDLMYHNVLQRNPDAAGRAFWIDQLASGKTDRGGMLFSVVQSQEFKAAMVDDVAVDILYLGLLNRTAAVQETAYWMGQYSQYADAITFLQAATASTTEYHDRFIPTDGSTPTAALVGVVDGDGAA